MSYAQGLPSSYAVLWHNSNMGRWNGEFGRAVRRMIVSPAAFPGTPASAIVGFASAATQYEDTGNPTRDGSIPNRIFREVGYLNTEAGQTFIGANWRQCACLAAPPHGSCTTMTGCTPGPSPNPDPSALFANYARWANHPYVTRADMLGQPASLRPHGWYDIPQQTAVGLVNMRWHSNEVSRRLPAAARASHPGSLWALFLAFGGFSAGDGRMAGHLQRYADALSAAPESQRVGTALWLFANGYINREAGLSRDPGSHNNPAFSILRCAQKLAAGRDIQRSAGLDTRWFDTGLSADAETAALDVLTRVALGEPIPSGLHLPPMSVRPAGAPTTAAPGALPPPVMPHYNPDEAELIDKARLDYGPSAIDVITPAERKILELYGPAAFKRLLLQLNGVQL